MELFLWLLAGETWLDVEDVMILFSSTQVKTARSSAPLCQRDPSLLTVSVTGERPLHSNTLPAACAALFQITPALFSPVWICFSVWCSVRACLPPSILLKTFSPLGENTSSSTNHSKHLELLIYWPSSSSACICGRSNLF